MKLVQIWDYTTIFTKIVIFENFDAIFYQIDIFKYFVQNQDLGKIVTQIDFTEDIDWSRDFSKTLTNNLPTILTQIEICINLDQNWDFTNFEENRKFSTILTHIDFTKDID